jgi:hypothetical protein
MSTTQEKRPAAIELAAFKTLRESSISFRTLTPHQFVDADLNRLAEQGIFPENDFLLAFLSGTEHEILPLFRGDRNAFERAMKRDVEIITQMFEAGCYRYHFNALGLENVNFFVYCFCMIHTAGKGMNPYFMLTQSQEEALNIAFRHMVEDGPVPTIEYGAEAISVLDA